MLQSVRMEIDEYKQKRSQDELLAEKDRLDHAHSQADHIIEIAQGAHHSLLQQGSALKQAYRKFQGVLDSFPLISRTIGKIRRRRLRDTLILGAVIGIGMFVLYLMI